MGQEGWQPPEDWQEEATYTMGLQLTGRHTAYLQLTGTQQDIWQELGAQQAELPEEAWPQATGQHRDGQPQADWQEMAELHTGWHSRATRGALQEPWQLGVQQVGMQSREPGQDAWQELGMQQACRQPVEQLVWHMVVWDWSGVREEGGDVWRLLRWAAFIPGL